MTAENNRQTRLQKLSNSDFEMGEGQSDIRNWDVKDSSGKKLGEVDELIFDYESRKVRYLVLDLGDNEYDLDDKEVLVPIGIAELHKDDDEVILPGITVEQLRSLPEYDEDRFDTEHETSVRNVFGGLGSAAVTGGDSNDDDFYNHEHFNEDNLYRNRKSSEEKNSLKDINLRNETVNVERSNVDRPASEGDLREEEMEVREHNEVPVVNKEARVVEEVSLNKHVTNRDETISDTVRNTEVDVDRDEDNNRQRRNKNDD